MAGTTKGGIQAAATNRKLYGDDFYKKIASMGGSVKRPETRSFNINRELAREAGRKGGLKSKKTKKS